MELARGADVLVHEVMHVPAIEAIIEREPNAHFVPGGYPFLADETWHAAVRPHFSGNLVVGRDLLEI